MPYRTLPDGTREWFSDLDTLPDNKCLLLRWPPTNGGFVLAFNARVAKETKERGWIIMNGRRARVCEGSLNDDDERVDFWFEDWESQPWTPEQIRQGH